jgi:hypothetical protein
MLTSDLMSGIPTSEPLASDQEGLSSGKARKRKKCIKQKVEVINLHLGDNIKLNEVMELEDSTIVGHFLRKHMNGESLKVWMQETFVVVLGYSPRCMVLVKGWMIWILRSKVDVDKIIQARWQWGSQSLFLKKWHLEFDANSTHMDYYLIWVRLLGLPLILWSDEVFNKIGNSLGLFYKADNSYRDTRNMGMALECWLD